MVNLELNLPDELEKDFNENREKYTAQMEKALIKLIRDSSQLGRLEMVKTITRAKAPVLNWQDLEREIFEGGI